MLMRPINIVCVLAIMFGFPGSMVFADGNTETKSSVTQSAKGSQKSDASGKTKNPDKEKKHIPAKKPIDVVGVKKGEPIDKGFVFYKGSYLDAPYFVTRRGLDVLINDKVVVFQWTTWPLPRFDTKNDPGIPEGLTEKSTFKDIRDPKNPSNSHWIRKIRYLHANYPEKVAYKKMAEYFRQLPFVKSVKEKSPGMLRLKMKNGKEKLVSVWPARPGSPFSGNFTTEDLIKRLEGMRLRYERHLRKGRCLFLRGIVLNQKQTARKLKLVVKILRSNRSPKEKRSLLQRLDVLPTGVNTGVDKEFEPLLSDFKSSAQLDKRIEALKKTTGIEPLNFDEIPEKSTEERLREQEEIQRRLNESRKARANKAKQ
ncbi:MAG: hypothetical protein K8S55_05305 [Phycisphaerae bacterium]|nr:hypothetical protein [Phycisphaerae bacterium]